MFEQDHGRWMRCVECGRRAEGLAPGWRAYLTAEPDDEEDDAGAVGIAIFCPDCAVREFGLLRRTDGARSD